MKTTRRSKYQGIRQHVYRAASASAVLVGLAVRASLAQATPATAAPDADASTAAATVASPNANSSQLKEVIVTATRRQQNVQDVPATIEAFTGTTLTTANITSLNDLLRYTPNVTFTHQGPGQSTIYMRDVGDGLRNNGDTGVLASFPNVALYLNDESMEFPEHNADVYMVDMQRVEVLEGPQGTLFGGGAEAGAIRYITNQPKYNVFEGNAEAGYGFTEGGDRNNSENLTLNVPLIKDKLAARIVVYNDHEGGYIDNVPSTFTRSNNDLENSLLNIKPGAGGLCPNGLPAGAAGYCALSSAPQGNNYAIAAKSQNPTTYSGARLSVKGQIADDWSFLIVQSLSDLDAEGVYFDEPIGSDFQPLKPMQVTTFSPNYDHDRWESTAWTLNGKISDISLLYTGAYTIRNISQQMDYTNGSRGTTDMYYQCTGGATPWDKGASPTCYSPIIHWADTEHGTHMSQELRFSTPDDWRLRAVGGAYYENFKLQEAANYNLKTIPACSSANLAAADAGGAPCLADVAPPPGVTTYEPGMRNDTTEFGVDMQRGYSQTAAYGSADYDIIPHVLTVTGGIRWYKYDEDEKGSEFYTTAKCLDVPNGQCNTVNFDADHLSGSFTGTVKRANLSWHLNQDVMTYFTFSQGYRPGGFNRGTASILKDANGKPQYIVPAPYAPDSLNNYEVGIKSELFDRSLLLNLSAYYMKWKNIQVSLSLPDFGYPYGSTVNGADYDIKGFEAQFVTRPFGGVTLEGSGTYNKTSEASSPCLIDNNPATASFGHCITSALSSVGAPAVVPLYNPLGTVGSALAFAPRLQANFHVRYDWTVGDYAPWARAGVSYTGSLYDEPSGYPSCSNFIVPSTIRDRCLTPAYHTFDASLGVARANWTIGIYGENLANSHASTLTSTDQWALTQIPLRPLTIDVKLSASF